MKQTIYMFMNRQEASKTMTLHTGVDLNTKANTMKKHIHIVSVLMPKHSIHFYLVKQQDTCNIL